MKLLLNTVSLLVLAFLWVDPSLGQDCQPNKLAESVEVAHVIDGDTLILTDDRKIRLVGINTPELAREKKYVKQPWHEYDQPFSREARAALIELTKTDSIQLVHSVSQKDKYGRVLAHLYAGKKNLTEIMLMNGWGFAVTVMPDIRYRRCYLAAEARARQQKVGLWQIYQPQVAVDFDDYARTGFSIITGLVTRVSKSRSNAWLDIDDSVVVMIPNKRIDAFLDPIEFYEGEFVELRGWVIDRQKDRPLPSYKKRWMVTITHPDMLRLLR